MIKQKAIGTVTIRTSSKMDEGGMYLALRTNRDFHSLQYIAWQKATIGLVPPLIHSLLLSWLPSPSFVSVMRNSRNLGGSWDSGG